MSEFYYGRMEDDLQEDQTVNRQINSNTMR
jgi:hypothetical protein